MIDFPVLFIAGIISGVAVRYAYERLMKNKQSRKQPASPIRQTLQELDAVGGSGVLMSKAQMTQFMDIESPSTFRRDLAIALQVSEPDLLREFTDFREAGGSVFACLAMIDMYLDNRACAQ